MRLLFVAALLTVAPRAGSAEIFYTCTFPTLPSFAITYPDDTNAQAIISVANRPSAPLIRGQGSLRIESATVDGYSLSFVPANSSLTVRKGDVEIGTETGKCVRIGGPQNETALTLETEEAETQKPPSEDKSQDSGKWQASLSTSQFDDSPTAILSLQSEDMVSARFGGMDKPQLFFRCKENTTVAYVIAADHFLSDIQGYGRVDYRIDTQSARTASMTVSTDNKALGLWSGSKSIPFIKQMFGKEKLSVRLTPYNESPREFTFDIRGLTEAIKPLRDACNW